MPRSLRIEYPGAIYHILNRGNYRRSVFLTETSKNSFERILFNTCERYNWVLHAFCIMNNHYHLAIETMNENLSLGMQWLQSTFANRFNRLHKVNGHLFQGRYKSLVVNRDEYLGPLLHYIHLNPLRAKLVEAHQLRQYRWSSLWYLNKKHKSPICLDLANCLYYAGNLKNNTTGRRNYLSYLKWIAESNQEQKNRNFEKMCTGWALGDKDFKKAILEKHTNSVKQGWLGKDTSEAKELNLENTLEKLLKVLQKGQIDSISDKKSALWKVMIAHYMKRHTSASNGWLSEQLNMGASQCVSKYVSEFEKNKGYKKAIYKKMLKSTT